MSKGVLRAISFAVWFGLASACLGQSLHTRVFRSGSSFPSVVSVAPNGYIVAKSWDTSMLMLLDGYTPREIAFPAEIAYRVHQSRAGQIWTVVNRGLFLYHNGRWTLFEIPEIHWFLAEPNRHLRQIALLPAEVNHVLVLMPDRLLDFNAGSPKVRLLKDAAGTGLGEFSEIQEGANESIWISGTFGVAHIEDSARRITPQSVWNEFLLPNTNRVNTLQRVFENPPGVLTGTANPANGENRLVAQLRGEAWSSFAIPAEKIRYAWRSWDDTLWGLSTVSLFRLEETLVNPITERVPVSGAQYDMAFETNGVFWIASGEGLVRYAPYLWRSPPELEDIQSSVHSILHDESRSRVWLSTPAGLVAQRGALRRTYAWPEEIETIPPRQSTIRLRDGRILVEGQHRPVIFDPQSERFSPLPLPVEGEVHVVGQFSDGAICLWLEHASHQSPIDLRVLRGEELTALELPAEKWNRGDVTFVEESVNGDLWLGLGASLARWRKASGTVEHHSEDNGLRTERIFALQELPDGRVWCGTSSRIYEFKGQRWEPILNTIDRVTDIIAANGAVWVATLGGIHRFQDDTWLVHGRDEGLPGGAVYGLRLAADDRLWAATSRGAFVFYPDADPDPPRTLTPELNEFEKPAAGEPTVISFRGQDKWDYTQAKDLLFSYRLDEGGWTPFSNILSRSFQKLSAGNHVVEVLAMDKNGNKANGPGRLEFAVIVPWFKDPRLTFVLVLALCSTIVLAGLAVNRHLQLKRSYAEVEKIVAERTRDLDKANQELLHSQKMRALGTMAAGIAHDFNNILSIIKGSAQIIESNVEDKDKIRTRVSRIQTVVEQGTVIVKALLGLGKTDSKELSDCDMHLLLHETRKLLGDRFPETIQIQINASPEVPLVHCSPDVLQQILLNLILNAAEAMHNSGLVELTANVTRNLPENPVLDPEREEAEGTESVFVTISVADQGGGIPAENLSRIFEPFFTTKAFSSRRGTGLGLSMVYELAKAQGYGIAVTTSVGQGSTFSIIIPLLESGETSPSTETSGKERSKN